jgi:PAS domain S-box-containing protein
MLPGSIRVRALAFGAVIMASAGAAGQTSQVVPLKQALTDQDGDRVPDRIGDTVTVQGIVISDPLVMNAEASLVNFQDTTGGIVLFTRDTAVLRGLERGDSVRVRGRLDQYLGAEQLLVEGVEPLGRAAVPQPRDVLVSDLQGEQYFGRLVRVAGQLAAGEDEAGRTVIELRDRTGSIQIYISNRWMTNPAFVDRLARGGGVEVVGVASQEARSVPPADGYRLVPRSIGDFHFPAPPPYGLFVAAGLAGLAMLLLWWHRRERQRARHLEELTEQLKRSQAEMRAREERFRSLVENAADTVSILDTENRVLYQSPSVRRMLGWNAWDLEGRDAFELVHPEDREQVARSLADLGKEPGDSSEVEFRLESKDGSWRRVKAIFTNRLHDPAVQGIVCNMRDITQHKILEQLVRDADRIEAVGRLAGGIAHDFNNVLTALRGHAELALEEIQTNGSLRHEVEEIVRSSERATALTQQLLAFSRQRVMQPKVIEPAPVLDGMLPMLRRLIGEDIELVTAIDSDASSIRVDPVQLEQVVMNLVVNARDAMPDGGRMTLQLADDGITPEEAAEYPYEVLAGPYTRLSVADTGRGMDEEVLSHVFDPFFTTKGQGEGTGLGLATLYGIVKQSGGYVWASSELGKGSRFDVFLPAVPQGASRTDADSAGSAPRGRGQGEIILLVEDEDGVRRLVRKVLEKNGYRVMEAEAPALAIDMVRERTEHIDLLFTDVVMPGMSGGELSERLRELQPDLLTLFTSGYTEDQVVRRGVSAGEAEFLEKPFTPDQLLEQIQTMLSDGHRSKDGAAEAPEAPPVTEKQPVSTKQES